MMGRLGGTKSNAEVGMSILLMALGLIPLAYVLWVIINLLLVVFSLSIYLTFFGVNWGKAFSSHKISIIKVAAMEFFYNAKGSLVDWYEMGTTRSVRKSTSMYEWEYPCIIRRVD